MLSFLEKKGKKKHVRERKACSHFQKKKKKELEKLNS